MKSRIFAVFVMSACITLVLSSRAFSQSAEPTTVSTGTDSAVATTPTESAGPAATAPTAAATTPSEAAEASSPGGAPTARAPEPVPEATTNETAAASATTTASEATAIVSPSATDTGAAAVSATAPSAAAAISAAHASSKTSTAEVIELTPEQQNVAGAEIVANPNDENKISVTLDNVPLQDVIRMFTRISGANIVSGTNLVGNVTVNLQDVEWEPALRVILDVVDMALVEKSEGIFAVVPKGELASEPVVSETIFLNYSTVSNILPVINKLLAGTNSSAAGFPSANAIVIQETRPRLNLIKEAIQMIDRPRPQVLIEAKFVELNDQAIKDLGINWQVLQGYTVRVSAPTYSYQKTRTDQSGYNDSTVYRDITQNASVNSSLKDSGTAGSQSQTANSSAGNSATANSGSSFSSTPPDAPLVTDSSGSSSASSANSSTTAGSTSQSSSDSGNTTASISGKNFTSFANGTLTTVPTSDRTRTTIDSLLNETVSSLGAVLSGDEFALTLSALKQNSGVEIVSNPKIIVASGEKATIHVGVKQPNYETLTQPGAGNQTTTTRQLSTTLPFIDTGVILEVEPTVNTSNNITVKIVPELSRILPTTGGFVGDIPPIQTRKIVSQFNLESGRTVAIGGLTQSDEEEAVTKIPFLGDIPIIGTYLFSYKHTLKSQDEVIIFVTVAVANPSTLVQSSGIPEDGKLIYRHLARRVEENAAAAQESMSQNKKKPDWMTTKH